jgi:hypothetical protein
MRARRTSLALASAVVALAAAVVALTGCTSPSYTSGRVQCAPGDRCPDGFQCRADHHCWRDGTGPVEGNASLCATTQARLCDGFETEALDGQWTPGAESGLVMVDTTRAYRGTRSLHAHTNAVPAGSVSSAGLYESRTFPQATPVYVRVWAYLASPFPGGFNQLVNFVDNGTTGISFSIKNGFPVLNAYTSPIAYHESTTVPVPVDRWTCLQFDIGQGAPTGDAHLFVDGAEVSDAVGHDVSTTAMRGVLFGLDFISDSGTPAADLWLDEIAVGDKPIGCAD